MKTKILLSSLLLSLLVSCGGTHMDEPKLHLFRLVGDAVVNVEEGIPTSDALGVELSSAMGWGIAYWGYAEQPHVLMGWTINIVHRVPHGELFFPVHVDQEQKIITMAGEPGCLSALLPHAIGHVVLNDPSHHDPRWAAGVWPEPWLTAPPPSPAFAGADYCPSR